MLFEQKSWRKSSVEMEICPYKSLTTFYFLLRFPQRFIAVAIKDKMDKQIFLRIFLRSDFKTLGYDPKGVLGGLERADRSSLMADGSKTSSRCVIGRILS